ncbi:hypothetical protein SAMN05444161_2995 [Rhizobiales bacterium GAS191]|nr:hypothetical protein SAMN05444161_2995 [Rhizobiales bacterium GAS191]
MAYVASRYLYVIYGTPCAVFNCESLFKMSYMPINRYWIELKQLGIDPKLADFDMFFMLLTANYCIIFFTIFAAIRVRIFDFEGIRRRSVGQSIRMLILSASITICFWIAIWTMTEFNTDWNISNLSTKYPMSTNLIKISLWSFFTSVFFGLTLMLTYAVGWRIRQGESNG